jgi:hypothetical protein
MVIKKEKTKQSRLDYGRSFRDFISRLILLDLFIHLTQAIAFNVE